jgi:hypothetical protein
VSDAGIGYAGTGDATSDVSAMQFFVRSMLARVRTTILVRVQAVSTAGGLAPAGTVDVLPLANQQDGAGNIVPHATIYGCPYSRMQGGANAIILDPQVGDIGIACFADRDISSVIANKGPANPGSRRMHDMADGLYVGACLNGTPSQFVQFNSSGITLTSPVQVTINAPLIALNGQVTQTQGTAATGAVSLQGPVSVTNDLTASGTSVHTHHHGGVQTGGGTTGVPI